jgi:hypothetical protein
MKNKLQYRIEIDNRDAVRKFKQVHRAAEDFADALKILHEEIKIGVRIVPIKEKKWYQFWK